MRKRKIFLIIFPLFLGIFIYFLYRSRNLFYFNIFKAHPTIYQYVLDIRDVAWLYRKHLPLWAVYSLPDGLWLFSFGITLVVDRVFYQLHFVIFTAIYIFMILLEFLQKHFGGHGTPLGTFDKLDILFFTLAYLLVFLLSSILNYKNNSNSKEVLKKDEVVEDLKIILIFSILGALPSLF